MNKIILCFVLFSHVSLAMSYSNEIVCIQSLSEGMIEYDKVRREILYLEDDHEASFENMNEILPGLFLGDQQSAYSLEPTSGISRVLSCRSVPIEPPHEQFVWKQILLKDESEDSIFPFFDETYQFIDEAQGGVLVHCKMGVSRSASIVIAYLMKKFHVSFESAYRFVQLKRPIIAPYKGFIEDLKNYEKVLKQRRVEICGQDDSNIHQVAPTRT